MTNTITLIRINMVDQFSGATQTKTVTYTPDRAKWCDHVMLNSIVVPEFSNNIRWEWTFEEVEYLN